MKELQELRNEVLTLRNYGIINKEKEKSLLTKLNALQESISATRCCMELPIKKLPNCNRVEVIDQKGRSYVNWQPTNKVSISMQDDGKTAKIFIE
jgi:hypothetical protein